MSIELINIWNKKYPITCFLLFDPLSISHGDVECCAENCSMMLETPLCNYRSTAPCRVHDMPDDIDRYNDSGPVHILFCKMQDYHESLVESYNVFDFQFPLRHSSFSFDIHKEDIRDLYRFLNNDILFPNNKVYPESVSNESFMEVLDLFFKKYNMFGTSNDFEVLLRNLSVLNNSGYEKASSRPCFVQSNIIMKAILAFQAFTDIRVTYIEGRHRHVKCLSTIAELKVPVNVDSLQFSRRNDSVSDSSREDGSSGRHVNKECKVWNCQLFFHIYMSPTDCSGDDVIKASQLKSRVISKEQSLAVSEECCHE